MKDKTLQLIKKKGPPAAIQQLNRMDDVLRALITYDEIIRDLYWNDKDLPAAIALAQAAIEHGLAQAELTDNPELAFELRAKVKAISYNLASFTWPGWDEPGIDINPEQIAIGLEAAQTNLDMAVELNRDALPRAYAHWVLGVQHIAAGDLPGAKTNFNQCATLAEKAGEHSAVLLANGFAALADMLATSKNAQAKRQFTAIKTQFQEIEHGQDYIQQLNTAWKVFSPSAKQ
jgi:hypothetical protein